MGAENEGEAVVKYMLLICSDGVPTDEKAAAMQREIPGWVQRMQRDERLLYAHALEPAKTARTVRVRAGEQLVSDGPFAESKEFVAGFKILECDDLDQAIEAAAQHPVSWFHAIEVRPFSDLCGVRDGPLVPPPTTDGEHERYLMLMCIDGIAEAPDVEEAIARESTEWGERMIERGAYRAGSPLEHVSTATTVRVRDGQMLLTDGPFVETKEFIGGFTIADCESIEQAVAFAAEHPLARFHMVEVRPFAAYPPGDERHD